MLIHSRIASVRPATCRCSRRVVVVRSIPDDTRLEDTPGVDSLLSRDRKKLNLQPELADEAFGVVKERESGQASTSAKTSDVLKSKRQRREEMARAAGVVEGATGKKGPKKCKEAIDAGLELFQQKDFQKAISMFNLALELPGNGAYRLSTSPREFSCPSDAEENAALYNMACCYAQMGQKQAALTCLEAVLENGFTDFATIRTDPDLAPVGRRELDDLVGKFDGPVAQVRGLFGAITKGGKKEVIADPNQKKPWIVW